MRHWLIKSEPTSYPYSQLVLDRQTAWTGIRNNTARLNLLAMAPGDLCLYYHSNVGKEVVGIAEVVTPAYPEVDRWVCVDIKPVHALAMGVSLAAFKADPLLSRSELVRQSRLSVAPVTPEEYARVLALSAG
ncbi:MAG: EVE domain-containing protein [Myxococcales bacterium]|nr:EVE domain-containing protein [Myxococcales bacterium]